MKLTKNRNGLPKNRYRNRNKIVLVVAAVLIAGWIIPQRLSMPVESANRIDRSPQGWKKMFYLNPIPYLNDSFHIG